MDLQTDTPTIAAILGCFFVAVYVIKGFVNRARKRRISNEKAAAASGGTVDSPVQLFDPFAQNTSSAPAPVSTPAPVSAPAPVPPPTPAPVPATLPAPMVNETPIEEADSEYKWK